MLTLWILTLEKKYQEWTDSIPCAVNKRPVQLENDNHNQAVGHVSKIRKLSSSRAESIRDYYTWHCLQHLIASLPHRILLSQHYLISDGFISLGRIRRIHSWLLLKVWSQEASFWNFVLLSHSKCCFSNDLVLIS